MKRIRIQLILYLILILIAFWISYIIIYGSGGVVNRANLARELGALEHEMNDLEKETAKLVQKGVSVLFSGKPQKGSDFAFFDTRKDGGDVLIKLVQR